MKLKKLIKNQKYNKLNNKNQLKNFRKKMISYKIN